MATAILDRRSQTLAEIVHNLGDIPLDRIRFPVGDATEADVVKHLNGDDKRVYELVDGVLVQKAMGYRESLLAKYIGRLLDEFAEVHGLGIVTGADGPYQLDKGRIRFPDTSFISWKQFPEGEIPEDAICDAVPELVVEVISEGNTPREMKRKLKEYFAAGVQLVWYVYPETQLAVVFISPTKKKDVSVDGTLDGGKILPGFSLPVAKMFSRFNRKA